MERPSILNNSYFHPEQHVRDTPYDIEKRDSEFLESRHFLSMRGSTSGGRSDREMLTGDLDLLLVAQTGISI